MPNRTLCDVLSEMRALNKTRNYSPLDGLIEEAQIMGNRMEAGLYDAKDIERLRNTRKQIEKQIEELRKHKIKLGGKDEVPY